MATYELHDPRAVERGNQNSLRKYPFSDAAACGNGACTIPPGAVVDAQLYVPGREPGRVWLSRVDARGILHFADAAGEFVRFDPLPGGRVQLFQREIAVTITYTTKPTEGDREALYHTVLRYATADYDGAETKELNAILSEARQ